MRRLKPQVLLLQEIRCLPEQLPPNRAKPRRWKVAWHPAEKKGYAGVATWSRAPLEVVDRGMGATDPEGRILVTRTSGMLIANVYLPSGSRSPEAQERKEAWMASFAPWAAALARTDEPVVLAGDLNIAHTEADIHNPSGNKRNSGFLPQERAWFGELLDAGWTDLVRRHVGPGPGPWSWWSNRGRARALDRGWRIDYILGNAAAAECVVDAFITRKGGLDTSDHAPVTVDFSVDEGNRDEPTP